MMAGLVGQFIGGLLGQFIYAALIKLGLTLLFKVRLDYMSIVKVLLILFVIVYVISFLVGFGFGAMGMIEVAGILGLIIAGAVFFIQPHFVSKNAVPVEGPQATYVEVLLVQIGVLVVAGIIGFLIVLAIA